jgi:hypothetical protein
MYCHYVKDTRLKEGKMQVEQGLRAGTRSLGALAAKTEDAEILVRVMLRLNP